MMLRRTPVIHILLILAITLFAGCAGKQGQVQGERTVLKVAPYPTIPGDYKRMLRIIEEGFEAQHPAVDLQLVPAQEDVLYVTEGIVKLMSEPVNGGGVHIAEIDTLMLGEVAQMGLLADMGEYTRPDWHPIAIQGATLNGVRYGVPHWLCGNFLMTKDRFIAEARSVEEMVKRMKAAKAGAPWLSGNYVGSSYLTDDYLQAWAENHPAANDLYPPTVAPQIDSASAQSLAKATGLCEENGQNPCVDRTYHDDMHAYIERTVQGDYLGVQGFSETIWYLVQQGEKAEDWYVVPLPVGKERRAVLTGDAYILRKTLSGEEKKAAYAFLDYMQEPSTYLAIIMSGGEEGKQAPRYVIPSRTSVFELPGIKDNVYYQRVRRSIEENGVSYPNIGIAPNRDRISDQVMPYLVE